MGRIVFYMGRGRLLLLVCCIAIWGYGACTPDLTQWSVGEAPAPVEQTKINAKNLKIFDQGKAGQASKLPPVAHLSECLSNADCGAGTKCERIYFDYFGDKACYFKCNPKESAPDGTNKACILPEVCIPASNTVETQGLCGSLAAQFLGVGTYKALSQHKLGEKCLLNFGGCSPGLICVYDGSANADASIGRCVQKCEIGFPCSKNEDCAVDPDTKVAMVCKLGRCATRQEAVFNPCTLEPGTKCQVLASSNGACLK